ncbi:hypothetical protein RDG71_004476 [Vibrio alginolyticus]|nr:hypothetical protein [Vibrio alginolyticus]
MREKVKNIIDQELSAANINISWTMDDIHVIPNMNTVLERTSSDGVLSEALINHHFPQIIDEVELAHYTSYKSFESIIKSKELRLYSILKRIDEQEFLPFVEEHGLKGYLDEIEGEPYYKTLMKDLFYTSFTNNSVNDEDYMWNYFGDNHSGVKIVFKLKVIKRRADLRPVLYHSNSINPSTVIKSLSERILQECNRHFVLRGISRICAFYLPLGYQLEKEEETRLLVKSWGEGVAHDMIENDGEYSYIPLKIGVGENDFCEITISEVLVGNKCDKAKVTDILNQSDFETVVVI